MGKQPYRVLQVLTTMNRGGAETMIMNHYRQIDRAKVQFDFLVHRQEEGAYDQEILEMGGRIYRAMPIRPWSYWSYFRFLDSFFREHNEFVAVHSHIQENSGFVLKYAAKYGIKNRIANSHIADLGIDYKYIFREIGKRVLRKYVVHKFSCGQDAGEFLYGKGVDFKIFHNAIDLETFVFDKGIRDDLRTQMGLNGKYVIANVGRFNPQKNHQFLIKIFAEICKRSDNVVLMLVGDGYLQNVIEQQVDKEGLNEKVLFLGVRNDVAQLLQACDTILFPSLFEGLPVSIIEAQAAGLPCVLSDEIDSDVDVTGNVQFVSLNDPVQKWVDAVFATMNYERVNTSKLLQAAGYDIKQNADWLTEFYLQEV